MEAFSQQAALRHLGRSWQRLNGMFSCFKDEVVGEGGGAKKGEVRSQRGCLSLSDSQKLLLFSCQDFETGRKGKKKFDSEKLCFIDSFFFPQNKSTNKL